MVLVLRLVWAGDREWKRDGEPFPERENLRAKGSGFLGFARNDMAVANIKDREPVPVLSWLKLITVALFAKLLY